jgi:hypothetical protein
MKARISTAPTGDETSLISGDGDDFDVGGKGEGGGGGGGGDDEVSCGAVARSAKVDAVTPFLPSGLSMRRKDEFT